MNREEFEEKYEDLMEEDQEKATEFLKAYEIEEEEKSNKLCITCTIIIITSLSTITALSYLYQS